MRKLLRIVTVVMIALLGMGTINAKTTAKRKTTTTKKTSASKSFVKWHDDIPTPEYIYSIFFGNGGTHESFYKSLEERGYEETEDSSGYVNVEYYLPDVCSFYWEYGRDFGYLLFNIEVSFEDEDDFKWFKQGVQALQKKDRNLNVYYDKNSVRMVKYFL